MRELKPGQCLARYEVVRKIGEGGFAKVYEVRDGRSGKTLAAKVLVDGLAGDPERREHFFRVAKAWMNVRHGNVVALHDAGISSEGVFLAMELLRGRELGKALAAGGRMEWRDALPIFRSLCSGIRALHEEGIIHRALGLQSVFLHDAQGGIVPKIMDSPLCRVRGKDAYLQKGTMVGVPDHMAPEQVRLAMGIGASHDERIDVYSLGSILYRMLAGRSLFPSQEPTEAIVARVHELPADLRSISPAIPLAVGAAVMKAVATEPEFRYQSMREMGEALSSI
jgi:serine/threonine-protein kinase